MNKIILILVCVIVSCNKKNNQKLDSKNNITEIKELPMDTKKYLDSPFSIKIYEKIYDEDILLAKEYLKLKIKMDSNGVLKNYIKCDELSKIDFSNLNEKKIDSIYTLFLTSENDNCLLELIDTLVYLDKNKDVHLLHTITKRFDGYVSEYYQTIKK